MVLPGLYVCVVILLHQSRIKAEGDIDVLMTTNPDQQQEIVDMHNSLRRAVDPPARNMLKMEWNDQLAKNSQKWANKCALDHSSKSSRKMNGTNSGENLYMSTAPNSWSKAIQAWYDEVHDFEHGYGAIWQDAVVGHYTQVVWYLSYKVGCAVAKCPNKKYTYYYVCQYSPAGNRKDLMHTPYAEGKPCEDCPKNCDDGLCTNPCTEKDMYSNCPQLKEEWGCEISLMSNCKASCKCTTEIK
nr:cysteine-rich venom protein helothermine-like [Anolis sagrei ordinatus]